MFDLSRPCSKCPFTSTCPRGWLGTARAAEIVHSVLNDQTFPCHETTVHDDDGEHTPTDREKHCAGATIFLEKQERPNQMMRICERLGSYDRRKLDMDAPVFESAEEMIEHHRPCRSPRTRRQQRGRRA